ncbi:MAG: gliding motility-associated C-terminal domain-containing protein, partial [Cyclobacteriaceae bacterium]|nr:gliding motility-associated C-terminal domain-containing protein [Cyclobacteriaceae bacterium]
SINVTAAGSYTLIVTDAGGCSSPSSAAVSFTAAFCNQAPVINPPTVNATLQSTVDIVASDFITDLDNNLDLTTLSIVTQPISGAPASVDASFNIVVDYSDTQFAGTDALTIQVCDVLGACSQADVTIEVAGEITVFNALSPNADGKNDAFYIQYIDALPNTKANKVAIFDRNGNVVFSIDNYDNQSRVFTGLSNSGTELPPGTYYYVLEFTSGLPKQTGFIALRK